MAKKGTTKFKSNKQEKSVSKELNGKTVVGSGARWFADSDVKTDKFLVECKTTSKNYFAVTTKLWEKIAKEAVKDHWRIPLMVIDLNDDSVHEVERYVVFSSQTFDLYPQPYDCTFNGVDGEDAKSFRVTAGLLDKLSEENEMQIFGRLFNIKSTMPNKVRHNLYVTTMDIFKEFYKNEFEEI